MNLFLDASVVLAACGRSAGGSRALFHYAETQGWILLISSYVLLEVEKNLQQNFAPNAVAEWRTLKTSLMLVKDIWTFDWAVVFPATKDRPVLFTAAANADVLLTLDRADFAGVMRTGFYGLPVMKPGEFLTQERNAGRLR